MSLVIVTDPMAQEIITIVSMCLYLGAVAAFTLRSYLVGVYYFSAVHWMLIVFGLFRAIDLALDIPATIAISFAVENPDFTFIWIGSILDSLMRPLLYISLFLATNRWVGKIQAAKGEGPRPNQPRRKFSVENLVWGSMVLVSTIGIIQALQNILEWIILIDYTKIRYYTVVIGFYFTWFIGYLIVTLFLNAIIILYYLRYKFVAIASHFYLLVSVSLLLFLPVIFDFADAFAATRMMQIDKVGNAFEVIYFLFSPLPEVLILCILAWRADEFETIVRLRSGNDQPLERLGV